MGECRASGMRAKAWCEEKGIDNRKYVIWATKQNKEANREPQQ
ncbi:IS66 family insertion sequence element accessory protein TnpA [Heliobacterium mobile]